MEILFYKDRPKTETDRKARRKEVTKAAYKRWYEKNKEKKKAYNKEHKQAYYAKNKEHVLETNRKWREENKPAKKEAKVYETKSVDLSQKIPVRLNSKTVVYVLPGTDVEQVKRRYLKTA